MVSLASRSENMTLDEFLAELAKTDRNWQVERSGNLRLSVAHEPHCRRPITAVAEAKGRPELRMPAWYKEAAEFLGLTTDDWLRIIHAADVREFDPSLRARLLVARGLEEQ